MADLDDDGPDLETLQAQIDMSMAFTQNLVSGWMKASKVKLPSSQRQDDRELEDYMRRPPRLGVGHAVPESTGVLSRDTAKLRNRLVGNGKKRGREDDDASGPTSSTTAIVISDDEDSRAQVITKKARVDPFATKKKNKKGPNAEVNPTVASITPSTSLAKKATVNLNSPDVVSPTEPPDNAMVVPISEDAASAPKRKKKKKKQKTPGQPGGAASPTREVVVVKDTPSPASNPPKNAIRNGRDGSPDVMLLSTPEWTLGPAIQSSPQRLDPFGMPLLNLSGPPPDVQGGSEGPPRKKRKKKKKKKQGVAASAENPIVIDTDGD